MKTTMMMAVVAVMGMASMAFAETGTWHRFAEYDIGNPNRPCPLDQGKPCPEMKEGKPCPMMLTPEKMKKAK